MGRKLNISQPAVIQTELRPLDESFWIDANGGFEQWYYQNTNVFAPDRQITPLILTPHLSAVDLDTNTKYTPTFQLDSWVVKEYIDGAWVTTTITSQSQTSDYVLQGLNLIVKKNNYDATHAINITCKATYQDPRDVGVLKGVEDSVMLVTSVDATQQFPKIDIVNPATRTYNPLKDESPIYEFEGKADWDGVEAQGGTAITECKVDPLGTEEILPTNDEMMLNAAPLLDVTYGDVEKTGQQFMSRQTAGGAVSEIVGGVAKITNIKGDTVKIIQVVDHNSSPTVVKNGITYVNNMDGSYTVSGATSSSTSWCFISSAFTQVSGHKYYIKGHNEVNCGGCMIEGLSASKGSRITSCTETGEQMIAIVVPSNTSLSNPITFYPQVFDLTAMGIDNLTTVEQVEAWLSTNIGNLDYIPYTVGKLVNFGGFGVKWNQISLFNTAISSYITNNIAGHTIATDHANHTITCNVTADKSAAYIGAGNTAATKLMGSFDNTHKYFFKFKVISKTVAANKVFVGGQQTAIQVDYVGTTYHGIIYKPDTSQIWLGFYGDASVGQGYVIDDRISIIDLTLMFGAGNEPDLDWCNKYFSKDYYDYCPSVEKNILDVMTTKEIVDGVAQYKSPEMAVKTTGFNVWDEEWDTGAWSANKTYYAAVNRIRSKNIMNAQLFAGQTIYLNCPTQVQIIIWDISGNVLANEGVGNTYKFPKNSYEWVFFTNYGSATYNHDICINLSDPSRNGTYEPHWESKSDMSWITKIGIENFNIWDEEWEYGGLDAVGNDTNLYTNCVCQLGYTHITPSTDYHITSSVMCRIFFFDNNHQFISYVDKQNDLFTTPSNAKYLRFGTYEGTGSTYNHDICINLSDPHFNGRYYPHGETAPYFPNGLCNVGNVYDEVKVVGNKIKGVVRMGSVDLGSLDYTVHGTVASLFVSSIPTKKVITGGWYIPSLCSKYAPSVLNSVDTTDKCYSFGWGTVALFIKDTTYTDATTFKSAMQGVMLYYELETPYEFEIDYPTKGQFMWYGVNGSGSEVPIDQLPIYSQATQPSGYGQGTSRININALYGENIPVILRVKRYPWSPTVLPPKVTKSVAWSIPPVDVVTTSDKGSAVRATNSSENFTFSTIVNQQGEIISDAKKTENMVFDWYMVKYGTSGAIKTSLGSGLTKAVAASTLKNTTPSGGVTPSTNIYCEAFLLGAYHLVDGQYVRTKD